MWRYARWFLHGHSLRRNRSDKHHLPRHELRQVKRYYIITEFLYRCPLAPWRSITFRGQIDYLRAWWREGVTKQARRLVLLIGSRFLLDRFEGQGRTISSLS
jgi:hypothetical protein